MCVHAARSTLCSECSAHPAFVMLRAIGGPGGPRDLCSECSAHPALVMLRASRGPQREASVRPLGRAVAAACLRGVPAPSPCLGGSEPRSPGHSEGGFRDGPEFNRLVRALPWGPRTEKNRGWGGTAVAMGAQATSSGKLPTGEEGAVQKQPELGLGAHPTAWSEHVDPATPDGHPIPSVLNDRP